LAKVIVCAKVDPEIDELLARIKDEYGVDKSIVIRLAIEWFAPIFYSKLKELELNLKLNLDLELEEWLKEVIKRTRRVTS